MITDQEHNSNLVMNAYHRAMEVYGYQVNVDNYTTMLESLPAGDWPTNLARYSSTEIANLPTDMSDEDVATVSDYQYRDRLRGLLRTEKVEQGKANRILNALKSQIGADADAQILAYKQTL